MIDQADAIIATAYRFAAQRIRDEALRLSPWHAGRQHLIEAALDLDLKAARLFPLERDPGETQ